MIAYLKLAEQAVEAGERLNGTLHVRLDEEMQRPFECDEPRAYALASALSASTGQRAGS